MLRITAIFLLFAFIWQFTSKLQVVISFNLNQDNIAKTLCENKATPSKHCRGKCFLMKELKKENQRENKLPSQTKNETETLFCKEIETKKVTSISFAVCYPFYSTLLHTGTLQGIDHPPTTC